jgi:hypothetical protein
MKSTVYEAAGGHQAFVELARAWHARCLADPIVSHAFSHGYHPQHSERLAALRAEAMGGPAEYTNSIGDQTAVSAYPQSPQDVPASLVLTRLSWDGPAAWRVNATLNVLAGLPTRCD